MFEIEIDGKKVSAEVSFYTAHLYEVEFRKDMIQDLLGVQQVGATDLAENNGELRIDFTRINWSAASRVLWAAIKTADDKAPSYTSWVKATKGVNLWLAFELLSSEVADCFFRAGSDEGEE